MTEVETRATPRRPMITDEALSSLRARIGSETRSDVEPNLEELGKDAIRHWVRAIGDLDPKWTDAAYAERTKWGGIIAPPSMVYAVSTLSIGDRGGLPGVHSVFAGAEHEWYEPMRRNDALRLSVVLKDVIEKQGKFSGRMIQQVSEVTVTNQDGRAVARSWPWGMRTERSDAEQAGKYKKLQIATYTPDDIQRISEQYRLERSFIRGAEPRYWDDVHVGDPIGPIIRGPWTITTAIAFVRAMGCWFLYTHAAWYDYVRRHPKAGVPNEQGIPEGPDRVHWSNEFAAKLGLPGAYDFGPERIAWLMTLCTYWCGDDGWLKRLRAEIRGFNLVGDLSTLSGTVVAKRIDENGDALVDCQLTAVNQRGDLTASAEATMSLPRRNV